MGAHLLERLLLLIGEGGAEGRRRGRRRKPAGPGDTLAIIALPIRLAWYATVHARRLCGDIGLQESGAGLLAAMEVEPRVPVVGHRHRHGWCRHGAKIHQQRRRFFGYGGFSVLRSKSIPRRGDRIENRGDRALKGCTRSKWVNCRSCTKVKSRHDEDRRFLAAVRHCRGTNRDAAAVRQIYRRSIRY